MLIRIPEQIGQNSFFLWSHTNKTVPFMQNRLSFFGGGFM